MEYRFPLTPGAGTIEIYKKIREKITTLNADRPISGDIARSLEVIRHEGFIKNIEEKTGKFDS